MFAWSFLYDNGLRHERVKDILEIFYCDTEETKPNNEAQEKDLEKRKIVINTVSKLYVKLLNIYTTQYDNFSED